jgi:hypothetical protein
LLHLYRAFFNGTAGLRQFRVSAFVCSLAPIKGIIGLAALILFSVARNSSDLVFDEGYRDALIKNNEATSRRAGNLADVISLLDRKYGRNYGFDCLQPSQRAYSTVYLRINRAEVSFPVVLCALCGRYVS